jgi:hypothetical protein
VIVARPANVFALPNAHTQAASVSPVKKLDPVPLKTILGDGRQIDISAVIANIGRQQFSTLPLVTGFPQPKAKEHESAKTSPPQTDLARPEPCAEAPTIVTRSKDAFSWWSGSKAVVAIPQTATQDQVSDLLRHILPPQQADGAAETALKFLHSHGGHALLVGITVGGLAGAILALFGYKKHIIGISIAAAIVAAGSAYFFGHEQNPIIGKWILNAIESHYQAGTPPREALYEIAEEGRGLKVSRVAIHEDGRHEDLAYHIDPNGKQHASVEKDTDSMTTSQVGNSLTTSYSKNGEVVSTETRSLSADQKRLTVTWLGRKANGEPYKNVAVYDRK